MEIIHLQKVDMIFETSCDRCNEIFPSSRDLNTHLFQAHIEEAISCEECDKMYFTENGLKRHMKKHEYIV